MGNQKIQYKYLIALLISLPLVPFLFADPVGIDTTIDRENLYWFMPLFLEFSCFQIIYRLSETLTGITAKERRLITILAASTFVILGVGLSTIFISSLSALLLLQYGLLMAYALVNVTIRTYQISSSTASINKFFIYQYLIPGFAACLMVGILQVSGLVALNIFALFLILRNFSSISLNKKYKVETDHTLK